MQKPRASGLPSCYSFSSRTWDKNEIPFNRKNVLAFEVQKKRIDFFKKGKF